MSFSEWLDTFKDELPICAYEDADEEFEKDFFEKAEEYKKEYLASKYAEETEEECDETIGYILECHEDY